MEDEGLGISNEEPDHKHPSSFTLHLPSFTPFIPFAIYAACALALHGPGLIGGPLFWERDTILFYQPLTDWFAEQLRVGRLPLWMPTTFAGYALLADGEVGPLYPFNLLALTLLPTGTAFVLLRALH